MEENEVTKADIKQFIRDVTSCGYYNRKIISLTNQLEAIHVQLVGVKSIAPKEYHVENKIPFSMQGINSLLIDEEKLILERDKYMYLCPVHCTSAFHGCIYLAALDNL